MNPIQRLLSCCARIAIPEQEKAQIGALLEKFTDWQGLTREAERQRMAPLLYLTVNTCKAQIPGYARRALAALALRHRLAASARARALAEILQACAAQNIKIVLLKGAALAHLAYPAPELRPMRDVDLLVAPAQAARLFALLQGLDFQVLDQPDFMASDKHFPALAREREGFHLSLEVHTQLYDSLWRSQPDATEALLQRARRFDLGGQVAWSLGLEDMLGHIYQHWVIEELRWIGATDLLLLAGRFQEEIDWGLVRRKYPFVLAGLSVLGTLLPLPDGLAQRLNLPAGAPPPDAGEDWQGWPRLAFNRWRQQGAGRFLRHTLWPSQWWQRLYYGVAIDRPLLWTLLLRHPLHILWMAARRALRRV